MSQLLGPRKHSWRCHDLLSRRPFENSWKVPRGLLNVMWSDTACFLPMSVWCVAYCMHKYKRTRGLQKLLTFYPSDGAAVHHLISITALLFLNFLAAILTILHQVSWKKTAYEPGENQIYSMKNNSAFRFGLSLIVCLTVAGIYQAQSEFYMERKGSGVWSVALWTNWLTF